MANVQESIERFDSTDFGVYAENISDLRKQNLSLSQGVASMTEEITSLKAEVQGASHPTPSTRPAPPAATTGLTPPPPTQSRATESKRRHRTTEPTDRDRVNRRRKERRLERRPPRGVLASADMPRRTDPTPPNPPQLLPRPPTGGGLKKAVRGRTERARHGPRLPRNRGQASPR